MKEVGVPLFPVKNFLSHSVAKLRKGPHLFHKNSGIEKTYGQEGLGGSTTISCQKFLSHSVAKLRKGPHLFHKISGIEKTYGQEGLGGSTTISCQKFLSHSVAKLRKGPHLFHKISGIEKTYGQEGLGGGGVSPFSVKILLAHSAAKLRPSVSQSFWY